MIEITHAQARRLLREKIDGRPISDEQWAILQAHLETCPECRADQEQLDGIEKGLTHALRTRWSSLHGPVKKPVEAISEYIFAVRRDRVRYRKQARYALQALLVLLVLASYTRYRQVTAPPTPTPTFSVVQVAGTGTPQPTHFFRGVVAVETIEEGQPQIALLNPGPSATAEISRLIAETAAGSASSSIQPAWSPDGEWVAFLSDRSGKNEVYVIHVSGTRLTQLTNDPQVTWQGPLTWSADGQWISLIGISGGDLAHSNVFLVPLNGSGARTLGFTREAPGPVAFSPVTPMLAFGAADYGGSLLVFNLTRAQFSGPTYQETLASELRFSSGGGLSWSPDGDWLAYVVEGEDAYANVYGVPTNDAALNGTANNGSSAPGSLISQIRVSYNYIQTARDGSNNNINRTVLSYEGKGAIQGLSWSPDNKRRLLAFLHQEPAGSCPTVHLIQAQGSGLNPLDLGGICVESGLSRASWTADGQWLVLLGRRPGEDGLAYYAMRVPQSLDEPGATLFERLSDAPAPGLVSQGVSLPQVRPTGKPLNLQPKAISQSSSENPPAAADGTAESTPTGVVNQTPAAPLESTPTGALEEPAAPARPSFLAGKVTYITVGRTENALVSMLPNGQVFQELLNGDFQYTCPAISPDGTKVAFLRAPVNQPAKTDVFVKDMIGTNLVRVSPEERAGNNPGGRSENLSHFSCPAWSPDGTRLAALEVTLGGKYRLLILSAVTEDLQAAIYIPYPSLYTRLLWSPDGKYVFLSAPTGEDHPARIIRCDLSGGFAVLYTFIQSTGWNDAFGMALSPDGSQFAYLSAQYTRGQTQFELHINEAQSGEEIRKFSLPAVETGTWFGSQGLDWLPDGRLGFFYRHRVDALIKTELYLVDPEQEELFPFANMKDVVYDLAWSPDGAWVIYAGENGLYALEAALDSQEAPQPVLLMEERASEVDWR